MARSDDRFGFGAERGAPASLPALRNRAARGPVIVSGRWYESPKNKRTWMDVTAYRFADCCLPLAIIADAHDWALLAIDRATVRRDGSGGSSGLAVEADHPETHRATSHLRHGGSSAPIPLLIRIDPGNDVWVGAPINHST